MTPKMRPRTKHINVKFHHFRDYVKRKLITILPIRSEDNPADTLTKPLPLDLIPPASFDDPRVVASQK